MIVFLIEAHNHTYTRLGPQPAVLSPHSRVSESGLILLLTPRPPKTSVSTNILNLVCRTTYEYAQQHPGPFSKMRLDFEDELKRGFFELNNYEGMTMWTSSTARSTDEARGGVSATHACIHAGTSPLLASAIHAAACTQNAPHSW